MRLDTYGGHEHLSTVATGQLGGDPPERVRLVTQLDLWRH